MAKMQNRFLLSLIVALWASALSAQSHWSFDYRQYQYDMTVYFELQSGGMIVSDTENYELAAFVGNECRGIGEFISVGESNNPTVSYGYLRIRSNVANGEIVNFRAYYKQQSKEVSITEKADISFEANSVIGFPSSPKVLNIVHTGDVNNDGEINAQDASLVQQFVARKFGEEALDFHICAGDVNGDGEISAQDASLIQQYAARKITW